MQQMHLVFRSVIVAVPMAVAAACATGVSDDGASPPPSATDAIDASTDRGGVDAPQDRGASEAAAEAGGDEGPPTDLTDSAAGPDGAGSDDGSSPRDGGAEDAMADVSSADAGHDAEPADAGADTGAGEAGSDAAPLDAGHDAAPLDAGHDAAPLDAGHDAAPLDAGHDAAPLDAGTDAGDASVVAPPAVGDLVITEVMFNPSGPQPAAEWFEVYNTASAPRLLSGVTIEDGYPRSHTIAASPPVVIDAQTYVLLVRDRSTAVANLVPSGAIVYEYGTGLASNQGIQLANGTSGGVSLWLGATRLANVPYGGWNGSLQGYSIELATPQLAGSDQAGGWCLAGFAWDIGSDYGTPGAPNDCP
jgi:hypothetical protein